MKTIRLYGALGKKYGRVHRLEVRHPAEAVRALGTLYSGFFRDVVGPHATARYRVVVGDRNVGVSELTLPCSDRESIRIIPVVAGAGGEDGGFIQSVVGIILIAVGSISGFSTVPLGVSLLAGGISQMMMDTPKNPVPPETPENKPSYVFDGAVNTIAQGNPVPLAYGEVVCGSQVISAGFSVEQLL